MASYSATAVFEFLGAQGTNIILHDDEEISIDIIPRFGGDGLDFQWTPNQIEDHEMEGIKDAISLGLVGLPELPGAIKKEPNVKKGSFSMDEFRNVESNGKSFISKKFR